MAFCPDIIVATPGRLWDVLQHGNVVYLRDLRHLQFLVLDEADRMIQHGHFADLEHILGAITRLEDGKPIPEQTARQSFVVSATMTVSEDVRIRQKGKKPKLNKPKQDKPGKRPHYFQLFLLPGTFDRMLELVHFQRKIEIVKVSGLKPMPITLRETMVSCPDSQKVHSPNFEL